MSASTSCSTRALELLDAVRKGAWLTPDFMRAVGEECPAEFFRVVIESLGDSFEPLDAAAYEHLMTAWIPYRPFVAPVLPELVETVYVLSRVTLGADIKITSIVLDAMKRRFPNARIALVSNRKSAELFSADSRIDHVLAEYPRSGPASSRIAFAEGLRAQLDTPSRIVVDPDSRITQLGLVPVCEPEHAFHFPSRIAGGDGPDSLSDLTTIWLARTFGVIGSAYIAPAETVAFEAEGPVGAISFGVGENESKRVGDGFEPRAISLLGQYCRTIWIDRGAGGTEAEQVTAAVAASGIADRVRFWEGSFAGFASLIAKSHLYLGYDSAGQHAAAACGVPLITVFNGAVSERFLNRWQPAGHGPIKIIKASDQTADQCIEEVRSILEAWTSKS